MKFKIFVMYLLINVIQCFKGENIISNAKSNKNLQSRLILNSERIFPINLNIVLYLTYPSNGLIFYSIDQFDYQISIHLKFYHNPILIIKLLGIVLYRDFRKLCNCSFQCLFMELDLQFKVSANGNIFSIQCGFQTPQQLLIPEIIPEISNGYPVPEFQQDMINEVFLYFINFPYIEYDKGKNVYPYRSSIIGCIKKISHQNISLDFLNNYEGQIKCQKQCIKELCNGGICTETYFPKPLCNCKTAFGNGDFCNNTFHTITKNQYVILHTPIRITSLKMSWISNNNKSAFILRIINRKTKLYLQTNEEKTLIIILTSKMKNCSYMINDIPVIPMKSYSIFIKMNNNSVEYQFMSVSSKTIRLGIIYFSMDKEFSSILVGDPCGQNSLNGKFDIVYQNNIVHDEWKNIAFNVYDSTCSNSTNIIKLSRNMTSIPSQSNSGHLLIIIILVVVILIIFLGVMFFLRNLHIAR